ESRTSPYARARMTRCRLHQSLGRKTSEPRCDQIPPRPSPLRSKRSPSPAGSPTEYLPPHSACSCPDHPFSAQNIQRAKHAFCVVQPQFVPLQIALGPLINPAMAVVARPCPLEVAWL